MTSILNVSVQKSECHQICVQLCIINLFDYNLRFYLWSPGDSEVPVCVAVQLYANPLIPQMSSERDKHRKTKLLRGDHVVSVKSRKYTITSIIYTEYTMDKNIWIGNQFALQG